MPFTVTMPKLSPTMEEGTIAKWRVSEGSFVKAGDVLIEVATDKATVEYAAVDKGYLRKILVPQGDSAIVNQAIAVFTKEAAESIEGYKPEGISPEAAPVASAAPQEVEGGKTQAAQPVPAKSMTGMNMPAFIPEPELESFDFSKLEESAQIFASPYAKKLAKEKNLDLGTVKGSGPHGRIVSEDLKAAQSKGLVSLHKDKADTSIMPGSYIEEKLSPMRKVIGQRLQESKTFIPHFYVTYEIDVMPLNDLRKQLLSSSIKLSVNDFVVKAAAVALSKHPVINSGFNSVSQSIIRYQTVDISIAVSIDNGLITPIVRLADHKSMAQISSEIKDLATRAKANKLERHEYMGGSFTISNLGMFGAKDFKGVINPPQAAILCVSGAFEKPVCKEGKIVPGMTMNVTLCSDHRVIDGADAAKFLQTFKQLLENPALLLI
jgi:pyruvate dehydrogenase E2 component (dihydrolipoamide acetyltransferase)